MLLHLVPQISNVYKNVDVTLVDVKIPKLDLTLTSGIDLKTNRPYPNKTYQVACRKDVRVLTAGLIVETKEFLPRFSVFTRWSIQPTKTLTHILTHIVHYEVRDRDFDTISDNHVLLLATDEFTYRKSEELRDLPPLTTQPRMEVLFNKQRHRRGEYVDIKDTYSADGCLIQRVEHLSIPSIERERLALPGFYGDKIPSINQKIVANHL